MALLKQTYKLIKTIYDDRRLVVEFSKKDFSRRFAGSFLGIGWAFFQPLLTIIVYWAVFQFGFRSGDIGEIPFVLWFLCAIVPWLYISEAFPSASNSFLEYSYLVKKVMFNINILPLVKIISAIMVHSFFLLIVAALCVIKGYMPSLYWIQIGYYLLCMMAFVFVISLGFSSIIVFFRDLNQIISILLLVGMWGTPIAWNIDMFPVQFQMIFKLNPVYYLIQGYRDSFLSLTWFWEKPVWTIYFWSVVIVLFFVSSFIYNRLSSYFADSM